MSRKRDSLPISILVQALSVARNVAVRSPAFVQVPIRRIWRYVMQADNSLRPKSSGMQYILRMAAEKAIFQTQEEVHDLPPIFHYWSNKHLKPILEQFGFSGPDDFFRKYVLESLDGISCEGARILSIGSGNCDTEIRLSMSLIEAGVRNFTIECVDVNDAMFERARLFADSVGVGRHLVPVNSDFNTIVLDGPYDAVIANQSLHHVVELEHLFDEIARTLKDAGRFIISDMIGRNGHQRWPEALEIVNKMWDVLDIKYKYNNHLKRLDAKFTDWDSSGTGFEGIRSQDIVPELLARFSFELFVGYGNVVDIFIERGFGPNFDPNSEDDSKFVDELHEIDEAGLSSGRLTPTHAFAVVRRQSYAGKCLVWRGIQPSSCVRDSNVNVRPQHLPS